MIQPRHTADSTFARRQGTANPMTKKQILRNQSAWANHPCPWFFDDVDDNFQIADDRLLNYRLGFHRKLGYLQFLDEGYNGLLEKYVRVMAQSHPGCYGLPHPNYFTHTRDKSFWAGMAKETILMDRTVPGSWRTTGPFTLSLCTKPRRGKNYLVVHTN
jgi:hypothetical protein